jgi:hypothetical protein
VIHNNDLVVGTHGRSFWILDDVTLLRQFADKSAKQRKVRLFKPRESYRYGSMFGFGHDPVPGLNYAFAATQIPAFDYEKTPDGETKTKWLDAGTNPPDGVAVHYELPEEPKGEVTMTFFDADGNRLRQVKSKKKEEIADEDKSFPPKSEVEELKNEDPFVPKRKGLNRFVWDLRIDPATRIATKGGDQPGRDGPKVVPGSYKVELEVDGETTSAVFTVVKDPRSPANAEEFGAQFDLLRCINAKHDELNQAVNRIRASRTQATDWARRAKGSESEERITEAAKALSDKFDKIEGDLLQVKIQSNQDSLNFPVKLNTKLSALAGMVGAADAAPTKQQGELFEVLSKQVDKLLAELKKVIEKDVPAFNKLISASGVQAIG